MLSVTMIIRADMHINIFVQRCHLVLERNASGKAPWWRSHVVDAYVCRALFVHGCKGHLEKGGSIFYRRLC